jgi:hypothetical protein
VPKEMCKEDRVVSNGALKKSQYNGGTILSNLWSSPILVPLFLPGAT